MRILLTGGTGYIGSHTAVELIEAGHEVVIVDNLSNSSEKVLFYIEKITGVKVKFYREDVCDENALRKIFSENKIDAVMHFAGYKAVGESVKLPLKYYINNLNSTTALLKVMQEYDVKKLIFSSSATVYGNPKILPITEECETGGTTNPYGDSKYMIEQILKAIYASDESWSIGILRYFNPVGAHKSGLIGENPNGIPNNLMPYIIKVATKELECLSVYGNDYDTPDGTGVRDYIHVVDLARGHVATLNKLMVNKGMYIYNLGTGNGYSVLDMITNFERINKVKVNYKITDRRAGDIATCYADPKKALEELGWKAEYGIEDMCRDGYNYVIKQMEDDRK
ncbi:MAG: UDP-glucose 4-epimerase GalE [Candidatus Coprovivens sp.]